MNITRRKLITSMAGSIVGLSAMPAAAYMTSAEKLPWDDDVRTLSFLNLHTGERADSIAYFDGGKYVPGALAELSNIMRDHRTGDVINMDPELMDLLHVLQTRLGSNEEIEIISAYRSPATNAKLAARNGGVAKRSYHMRGMAIDIAMKDRSLSEIKKAALSLKMGGVGKYRKFVHVDTGPVRSW